MQKAYKQIHDRLPIHDGIDVITVRGLSFKRFLEIARITNSDVIVITDNDGDYEKNIKQKYVDYLNVPNIKICYDKDNNAKTLELQIAKYNELETMNQILGSDKKSQDNLIEYMLNNKTECALKIFDSLIDIIIPDYIRNAIEE